MHISRQGSMKFKSASGNTVSNSIRQKIMCINLILRWDIHDVRKLEERCPASDLKTILDSLGTGKMKQVQSPIPWSGIYHMSLTSFLHYIFYCHNFNMNQWYFHSWKILARYLFLRKRIQIRKCRQIQQLLMAQHINY